MIVVRDIFQLHFGKARDAIALLKEGRQHLAAAGYPAARLLSDVTGEYYTLVMESRFDSMAAMETAMEAVQGRPESNAWRDVYARFVPLVHSGRREIFREID